MDFPCPTCFICTFRMKEKSGVCWCSPVGGKVAQLGILREGLSEEVTMQLKPKFPREDSSKQKE